MDGAQEGIPGALSQKTTNRIGSKGTLSRSLAQPTESSWLRRRGKEGRDCRHAGAQTERLPLRSAGTELAKLSCFVAAVGRAKGKAVDETPRRSRGWRAPTVLIPTRRNDLGFLHLSFGSYLPLIGAFPAQGRIPPRRSASASASTRQLLVPALPSRLVVFGFLFRRRGASVNLIQPR